jgi:hypothetical protein
MGRSGNDPDCVGELLRDEHQEEKRVLPWLRQDSNVKSELGLSTA